VRLLDLVSIVLIGLMIGNEFGLSVFVNPALGKLDRASAAPQAFAIHVSGGEEVSGQLQSQGMHVGGSFSSSVQLREIARETNLANLVGQIREKAH
jgi:hypothetical protein